MRAIGKNIIVKLSTSENDYSMLGGVFIPESSLSLEKGEVTSIGDSVFVTSDGTEWEPEFEVGDIVIFRGGIKTFTTVLHKDRKHQMIKLEDIFLIDEEESDEKS